MENKVVVFSPLQEAVFSLHTTARPQQLKRGLISRYCHTYTDRVHCATSRMAAGSIPDSVIGIFHWRYPSGRTMALRLTQSLTEMSTRNISWGVKAAGE